MRTSRPHTRSTANASAIEPAGMVEVCMAGGVTIRGTTSADGCVGAGSDCRSLGCVDGVGATVL